MKKSRVLDSWSVFLIFITISFEGQDYYISNNGFTCNMGIPAGSAWQILEKLNDVELALRSIEYSEVDSVFRNPFACASSATIGNRITYTRYGEYN